MKKLISLISATIFSVALYCQIDTVQVRNLSLKYEEWCTIRYFFGGTDSASKKFYKRFDATIKAANPVTMSTQVLLDSVPGGQAALWYSASKQWPDYIRDEIGDNIQEKIISYAPIIPYILGPISIQLHDYFINVIRKGGKQTIEN